MHKETLTSGRHLINPQKNSLLSRAQKLSKRMDDTARRTLYLLHNGIYAVHVRYKNSLRSDELVRIDQAKAKSEFPL